MEKTMNVQGPASRAEMEEEKYAAIAREFGLQETRKGGLMVGALYTDSLIRNYSVLRTTCAAVRDYLNHHNPTGGLCNEEYMLQDALSAAVADMDDMVYALMTGPKSEG